MSAVARFAGTVTNKGAPVEGTVTVATTTTPAAVAGTISSVGRFSVNVSASNGDTVTLTVDCGTKFTTTAVVGGIVDTGRVFDLSVDIGSGSITLPVFV